MTDPAAVKAALEGADAVIHCAAVVSLDARGNAQGIENSIDGARLVLHQAHAKGLDPIIHVSSVAALFEPGAGALTTDHPPSSAGYSYGQAKADAEMVARKLQADSAPITIVYPSAVIGPPAGSAFGEASEDMARFEALASEDGVPWAPLGEVGGDSLSLPSLLDMAVDDLRSAWEGSLEAALG